MGSLKFLEFLLELNQANLGALHVFQDSRHIEKHSRTDYKSQQIVVFVLQITALSTPAQ